MVREFFDSRGRPENKLDKEYRSDMEAYAKNNFAEQIPSESAKKYEGFLKEFSFDWLNSQFESLSKKSGVGEQYEKVLSGPSQVGWEDNMELIAAYSEYGNSISINSVKLEEKILGAEKYGLNESFARKYLLVKVLIHEAVHAYSKISCSGFDLFRKEKAGKVKVKTGLSTTAYPYDGDQVGERKVDAKDLNEGLTDFLADDLFDRYLEREGLANSEQMENLKKFLAEFADPYEFQKDMILDAIYRISEDTGVEPYIAYQGFIHQIMAEGPMDKELRAWMEQLYGKELFDRLRTGRFFQELKE